MTLWSNLALWSILAAMTTLAAFVAVRPMLRARAAPQSGHDVEVYRDQLAEIERDRTAGALASSDAESARIEVSRRLLAAADRHHIAAPAAPIAARRPNAGLARRIAASFVLISLPLGALAFYLFVGAPDLPGQPLAGRMTRNAQSFASMIARTEQHLEQYPEDGRGWEVIAPIYMQLERYADAVRARRNAIERLGETAQRRADLGEALFADANGVVTADAKAAFERARALDNSNPRASFYVGLAAEQDGDKAGAANIWKDIIARGPENAPWIGFVRQALARLESPDLDGPQTAPGNPGAADVAAASQMSPADREEMIRGMVDRLATRLRDDGSDVEGWLRLVRAYVVLGDRDKAKTAADEARRALASDADKLRRLDDGVKSLPVDG